MRAEGRDPQEHMCNVNTALTHSKTRNFIVTCSLFINKLHLDKCNQSRTLLTSDLGRKRGEGCVSMRRGSRATYTPPVSQVHFGFKEKES